MYNYNSNTICFKMLAAFTPNNRKNYSILYVPSSPGMQCLHLVVALFLYPLGIWVWVFWPSVVPVAGQCSSRQAHRVSDVKPAAISLFPQSIENKQ